MTEENQNKQKDILSLAAVFREAIENTPGLPVPLDRFPKGACGETCDLLAQWLWEHHIESYYYCGRHADGATHAWLEADGQIVDITGDQFPEFPYSIYVGPLTMFHAQFSTPEVEHDMKNGFHCYDPASVGTLTSEYKQILDSVAEI